MRLGRWTEIAALTALPVAILAVPATAQFVGALVNPLVANWIQSEVDSVENLDVKISGADSDLMGGRIERAEVSGDNLVYEDFYFSRVELSGQNIRLTVEDALNGGSLNLVEPLPVDAMMRLTNADVNRSIQAPSIQSQLSEAVVDIPIGNGGEAVAFQLRDPQVEIPGRPTENRCPVKFTGYGCAGFSHNRTVAQKQQATVARQSSLVGERRFANTNRRFGWYGDRPRPRCGGRQFTASGRRIDLYWDHHNSAINLAIYD